MSRETLYLGIDPGLAALGWGIIKKNSHQLSLVEFGVIKTSSKLSLPQRLQKLYSELSLVINKHQPDKAAIEKLFFGKNAKTAMRVGEARGVILLTLTEHKLTPVEYSPAEIKQTITGYGKADKNQIKKMVQILLNLAEIPKPDDAADALATAITHANVKRNLVSDKIKK